MIARQHITALAAAGLVATAGAAGAQPTAPGSASTVAPRAAYAVSPTADQECDPDPSMPKHQMRGLWVASVANIDWPSQPGLSPEAARAELDDYYALAKERGLNSVVVQVRPTADTFWPSELEPWSGWIAEDQGLDPGWDPMEYAVSAAHARGLDFHAWFNPYRVTLTGTDASVLDPAHPARVHPDWVVAYGGRLYYNPGVPEARRHTEDVIMEALQRYDIDGVHFDDYFYPYPVAGETFDDAAQFAAYGQGFADLADWRRHNVDTLIRNLDDRIHEVKPWVSFGVSPFAVWRNQATDPEGSATTAGAETYDDLYADTRGWVQQGWVDYITPQVYWAIGFEPADYAALVPWWDGVVEGTDVDLYIGQATYKVGTSTQSPEWMEAAEMARHLAFNTDYAQVDGDIYFSAIQVEANRLGHMDLVEQEFYSRPALPPVTDAGSSVAAPRGLSTHRAPDGTEVRWHAKGKAEGYAVYRLPGKVRGHVEPCDLVDATHLVAVLGPQDRSWIDEERTDDGEVSYVVTALSSDNTESDPSKPVSGR